MIGLAAGQEVSGNSTSGGNIVFTITGRITSGAADTPQILAQGFFAGIKELFVPTTSTIVTALFFKNVSGADTLLEVFIQNTGNTGRIYQATLHDDWSVSYAEDGWQVYDSDGLPVTNNGCTNITVSEIAPSNPSLGDLWVDIS